MKKDMRAFLIAAVITVLIIAAIAAAMYGIGVLAVSCSDYEQVQPEPKADGTYPVVVDYTQSLDEMIRAGEYNDYNSNFSAQNFPIKREGKVTVIFQLVLLNKRTTTTSDVLAKLDKRGLRPATLPELLAFGAAYKKAQKRFPVVALGSLWTETYSPRVAYLHDTIFGERLMSLRFYHFSWPDGWRFLAVSK